MRIISTLTHSSTLSIYFVNTIIDSLVKALLRVFILGELHASNLSICIGDIVIVISDSITQLNCK